MPEKDAEAIKEHNDFDISFDFCSWMSGILEPPGKRSYDVEADDEFNFLFTKTREGGGMQYYSEQGRATEEGEREREKSGTMSIQDKFSMAILLLLYTLQVSKY